MWEIRVLTGPQKGQSFPLSKSLNKIGRQSSCDVTLDHPRISKIHAHIEVQNNTITLLDLGSRNGTFVNGIQIKKKVIGPQDQIFIDNIHLQVCSTHNHLPAQPTDLPYPSPDTPPQEVKPGKKIDHFITKFHEYIEEIILPAVYKLPEIMELQWALAILILTFVMIVTLLSAVPATYILTSSVQKEAREKAVFIASTMERENRDAIYNRLYTAINIQPALRAPGVKKALIVSNPDGKIIAPSDLAEQYAYDTSFVYSAIKTKSKVVKSLGDNLIGVSIPINKYSSSIGKPDTVANAILIYDMSPMVISAPQTIGLYSQIFAIALIFGTLLLFLIYKIINYPIREINKQFDSALKDETSSVSSSYQLPSVQLLVSNINSSLNRGGQVDNEAEINSEYDRSQELSHLVQLMGFGAIGVTAHNLSIAAVNQEFEERTGLSGSDLLYKPIEEIVDQALKLSIKDLIERSQSQPEQIIANELEMAGTNYEIVAQSVYGQKSISYYLIVILPSEGSGESL